MPGRWTSSGSIAPLSTSSSHSTIVSFAAVAITGLKLRAGAPEPQVAEAVALRRAHERDVAGQRALEQVAAAVDLAGLLAVLDHGADAGRREERRDAGARGAHALGERALRRDLDLDLARRHPRVQILVGADVAADRPCG